MVRKYLYNIKNIKRYSPRTVTIYGDALRQFFSFALDGKLPDGYPHVDADVCRECLTPALIRGYEIHCMDKLKMGARSVNLHLSCLSSLCKYLVAQEVLTTNPVKMVKRPKESKRIPEVIKAGEIGDYLAEAPSDEYSSRLAHIIIVLLYTCGLRRAELIGLKRCDFYASRKVLRVHGKGDKMREIPLVAETVAELESYLKLVGECVPAYFGPQDPLLMTSKGKALYPMFIERVVKAELGSHTLTSGKISPHALRHSLATELLDEGADLLSIKELLGHSSLAATQVYTHSSIAKLKDAYAKAHPLAKE